MTAPQGSNNQKPQSKGQPSAPQRFVAGAIDLGSVKAQAEQREKHAQQAEAAGVSVDYVPRSAEVTPETFEQDLVIRSTQVVVVLLVGSSRSEASDQMRTLFGRMVEMPDVPQELLQWVFRYVDADKNPEMAQALGVQGVPTVLALINGRPASSFQGPQPEDQLEQWIGQLTKAVAGQLQGLPADGGVDEADEVDPRMAEAAELLESGDFDSAVSLYDAILSDDSTDAEARAARANALLLKRVGDRDDLDATIETAESDRSDVAAALVAADALLLRGEKDRAFDTLIATMKVTAGDEKAQAKDRLLELFAMFDPADEQVIAARTRMASALF